MNISEFFFFLLHYCTTPIDPACICMVYTLPQDGGLYQGSPNHLIFVSLELGLLALMMPLLQQNGICLSKRYFFRLLRLDVTLEVKRGRSMFSNQIF
jgi:hypothetical protein